jgi:rhodanese-related sulfurtransferase
MLKRGFKQMLAEANARVEKVSVVELPYLLDGEDTMLVDVRETVERKMESQIPGSIHVSRGLLEFHVDPESPTYDAAFTPEKRVIVYCGTGDRSALAANTLLDMGYQDVASLAGGYGAWRAAQTN